MAITDLRYAVYDLLEQTDDAELLNSILVLLRKSALSGATAKVAGYEADGEAISEDELVISILEASRDIRQGHRISFTSMKQELGL
jgi:hypothetical protein